VCLLFKKVLVAIDLSGPSMELLNATGDLKKLGLEELVIVHVIRREKVGIGINEHRERFLNRIEERKARLEAEGLKIKVFQPVGNPTEEITSLSNEENVDLIMIGSFGEGGLVRKLFLGSTVADVIRGTKKPILVEKYLREEGKFSRIPIFKDSQPATALLATDFSRGSLRVLDNFLDHPGTFNKVILCNVVDEGFTTEQLQENTEKAYAKLEDWKKEFAQRGFIVETLVVVGIASEVIIEVSKKPEIDLLAISRKGRSMVDELVIGSNADQVVRQSAKPVLILR
jgi:nucleotide-binding universal stress UspA family protein